MHSLGTPPMPWQQLAADIVGEVTPDGFRRWPIVIISVPRQSGKTTFTMALALHRILTKRGAKAWHTAQTGADARRKWLELVEFAERSMWRRFLKTRKTNGAEALECLPMGSRFSPHPPTEESLHGEQSDLNVIDEAWVFTEPEGSALMQAIVPTQSTRPGAQTVIISTMGTAASTWFHTLVERARDGADDMALIEYGISETDDPKDLKQVAACHPAYPFTINDKALKRASAQLTPAEFSRAYGNRATAARSRMIPAECWRAACDIDIAIPQDAPVTFGAAVSFDRDETCIAACSIVDGVPLLEIVECRRGTRWAATRVAELAQKHRAPVLIDRVGPSGTLADEAERHGVDVLPLKTQTLTAGCAELFDRITHTENEQPAPRVAIRPHGALDFAAEIVDRRRVGEAWAWSRRDSIGSIAALEAATLAMIGANHRPAPPMEPGIF